MGAAEDELVTAVGRIAKLEADQALLREQVVNNQRRIAELERAVMCGEPVPAPSSPCEAPKPAPPPPAPAPSPKPAGMPPWVLALASKLGEREVAGPESNPWIAEAHALLGSPVDDATAWCSSACAWAMDAVGVSIEGITRMARSWLRWGRPLPAPKLGCVAVLSRGDDPVAGHVGLVTAIEPDRIRLLAGNQNDQV